MPRKLHYEPTFGDAISELGFKDAARLLGRKGGQSRTRAKVQAARVNGKKGGRPKESKP